MTFVRILAVAALAAAALAVAACGEDDDPATAAGGNRPSGPDAKTRQALISFARCMREHGVDMPDPQFGEDGRAVIRQGGGPDVSPEKVRAADKACAHYREAVKPPKLSDEQKAEMREAALANARCMREHGIDFPDPQFSEDGGVQQRIGDGIDPTSQKFRDAEKACQKSAPGGLFGGVTR